MEKKNHVIAIFSSVIYFVCILLAARMLILFSGSLFGWIGPLCGLDAEITNYGKEILLQLRYAKVTSPWCVALGLSFLSGYGCSYLTPKHFRLLIGTGFIMSVPLILGAVMLTEVNGILTGKLVLHLLTLL